MHDDQTVLLALSGGVDSAVAALLLRERGFRVVGAFLKLWSEDGDRMPTGGGQGAGRMPTGGCGWKEERRSALATAARLGIPLVTLDREEEYRRGVLDAFAAAYAAGETPNPDIRCNSAVKFPVLREEAAARGIPWIATGHHARVARDADGAAHLLAGRDAEKDQSYFLADLSQEDLAATLFPIGELTKAEVRSRAKAAGIAAWDRRSTRGICFVGRVDLPDFLRATIADAPGPVVTTDGRVVGAHRGVHAFTIGQRHGFGGGGGDPHFVVAKDPATATLTVSADEADLLAGEATLHGVRWISGTPPALSASLLARPRHRAPLVPASFDGTTVRFAVPQRALAPGQQVVFYDGDECLGGGAIAAVRSRFAAARVY